jgi:hypothetical protein
MHGTTIKILYTSPGRQLEAVFSSKNVFNLLNDVPLEKIEV